MCRCRRLDRTAVQARLRRRPRSESRREVSADWRAISIPIRMPARSRIRSSSSARIVVHDPGLRVRMGMAKLAPSHGSRVVRRRGRTTFPVRSGRTRPSSRTIPSAAWNCRSGAGRRPRSSRTRRPRSMPWDRCPRARSCASSREVSGPSNGGTELKKLRKQPAWSCMWWPTSGRSNSGADPACGQCVRPCHAGLQE